MPTMPPVSTEEIVGSFQNSGGELPTLGDGESKATPQAESDSAQQEDESNSAVQATESDSAAPVQTPTPEQPSATATPEPTPTATRESRPPEVSPAETPLPNVDDPTMPTIQEVNGALVVSIPDVPPHTEASHTVFQTGSGRIIQAEDEVLIEYVMYGWNSKELVESTEDFGGPLDIILGQGYVPVALEQALVGQPIGSRILVIFPANMPDLPGYFDASDGYVLVVDIVGSLEWRRLNDTSLQRDPTCRDVPLGRLKPTSGLIPAPNLPIFSLQKLSH